MLADDVTLADIAGDLTKPESYVRSALENMYAAEKDSGALVIRIGRTGSGQIPHYRFDKMSEYEIFDEKSIILSPRHSFNGRNHKPLVTEGEEGDILRDEHWSRGTMTREELVQLLGKIRRKKQR